MTKDARPRRCRPSLEGLEARDLLSALAVHAKAASHETTPRLNLMVASETAAYAGASSMPLSNAVARKPTNTPAWVNESFLRSLVSQLYRTDHDDVSDHRWQPNVPGRNVHRAPADRQ